MGFTDIISVVFANLGNLTLYHLIVTIYTLCLQKFFQFSMHMKVGRVLAIYSVSLNCGISF